MRVPTANSELRLENSPNAFEGSYLNVNNCTYIRVVRRSKTELLQLQYSEHEEYILYTIQYQQRVNRVIKERAEVRRRGRQAAQWRSVGGAVASGSNGAQS